MNTAKMNTTKMNIDEFLTEIETYHGVRCARKLYKDAVMGGKLMLSKTYVQACLDGDANIFDLDDYIDYWHDNDTGVTLREFLGLTPYEYQEWGKNSDSIFRDILRCRREGIDFAEYERMSDETESQHAYDEELIG